MKIVKYFFVLILISYLNIACDSLYPEEPNDPKTGTLKMENSLMLSGQGVTIGFDVNGNFFGKIEYGKTKSYEVEIGYVSLRVYEYSNGNKNWLYDFLVKIEGGKTKKVTIDSSTL